MAGKNPFTGGSWAARGNPALLDIASPHDRSLIGRAAQAQPADIDRAVAAPRASFEAGAWRTTPPAERIADLISLENGSAAWFTTAGQPGPTRHANAYLKAAEHFVWEKTLKPSDPASPVRSVVRREPVGVVAAVIPWTSPFSSATTKIIPACPPTGRPVSTSCRTGTSTRSGEGAPASEAGA